MLQDSNQNMEEAAMFCEQYFPPSKEKYDIVDHPEHYNKDRNFEVIDVMEDFVRRCPDPIMSGHLFQVIKYLGRLFDKSNPLQDAKKARWYLDKLISKLEEKYGK